MCGRLFGFVGVRVGFWFCRGCLGFVVFWVVARVRFFFVVIGLMLYGYGWIWLRFLGYFRGRILIRFVKGVIMLLSRLGLFVSFYCWVGFVICIVVFFLWGFYLKFFF